MRYLLCTALLLAACEKRGDTARDTTSTATDTVALDSTVGQAPAQTMSAVPDRLIGSWTAKGFDAGSKRPQTFTITWSRAPDGSLVGQIAFASGEKYDVKVVSTSDTLIVYQSAPHRSPTLNTQVVTRTTAKIVGDSLTGTYTAKATKGSKVLKGRFTAVRK
ncbi:MAG TPA: hypothetical protein VGN76_06930 [Gemmatimonadales bacterium]|jgi:hypothetical protein|nr:hypothetical protein [Gemmatimonadales bacterium]